MKHMTKDVLLLVFFMTLTLTAFQNCGKGFTTALDGSTVGSSNQASTVDPYTSHATPHIISSNLKMIPLANLEFKVFEEVPHPTATYSWSHKLDGAPGACQIISGSASTNYIINCNKEGNLTVSVVAMESGVQIAVQDFAIPLIGTAPVAGSLKVLFQIAPGTGNGVWNAPAAKIEVYVGQTLTFQNSDTITHRLHTGGKPCPHGPAVPPGATYDCVIISAYTQAANGAVYEHTVGPAAAFNMIAYDGAVLYSQNCMGCHGQLSVSQQKNATYAQILNARISVSKMATDANVVNLTPKQIEAIAYALSK